MSWRNAAWRTVRLNRNVWSASASRIAVIEIHLDLRHALFVDQAVDADLLRLAIVVDVFEQRIEFVDRVDAVSLAARLRPPGFSRRRQERIVGIDVFG